MGLSRLDELKQLVESVPRGMVISYGQLGKSLTNPVSGFLAGKWMDQCPDVPWWRVVGVDGTLLIGKKDAQLALEQKNRLENEGVEFDALGRVCQEFFYHLELQS